MLGDLPLTSAEFGFPPKHLILHMG